MWITSALIVDNVENCCGCCKNSYRVVNKNVGKLWITLAEVWRISSECIETKKELVAASNDVTNAFYLYGSVIIES